MLIYLNRGGDIAKAKAMIRTQMDELTASPPQKEKIRKGLLTHTRGRWVTLQNGTKINGNFMKGWGAILYKNGDMIQAKFINGRLDGDVNLCLKNCKFAGTFRRGKLIHGTGKYIHPDGTKSEGEFKLGKLVGKGKISFPNGSVYEGKFLEGRLHGQGKISYKGKVISEGEFKKGVLFNGKGTVIRPNGQILEGNFKNGLLEGDGKITFSDGTVYQG